MDRLVAVTRAPAPALARCELTFLAREPIDFARAERQHEAYRAALTAAGAEVVLLPPDEDLPDAVFVEDTAVVLDEAAVITRPGSSTRQRETPPVAAALARFRRLATITAPATLDGGDVLRAGRRLFVGLSERTSRAGFERLAALARPLGYEAVPVRVHGCLHLKTAATALDPETLVVNSRWLDPAPFALAGFRFLEVPEDEPFAANTLTVGGHLLLSARWPRTRDLLAGAGFAACPLDISEFEKAEAGLTCLSLVFDRRTAGR